jgi:predicted ATP-grasp superfamily ATP-dependent carboligase
MSTPVLLVSTATRWLGTARIPRYLAKAGFEVSLLAPRDSLAEKSSFVSKVLHLPDNASTLQWVIAFAGAVKAVSPRIVIPCDDMSFRLLSALVLTPPDGMQPALHLQLAALVRDSLGDPAHFRTTVDKTLLPAAAEALGVRVPRFAVVATLADAETFAAEHGYPTVLKRSHGFAGEGVALCADRRELVAAFSAFSRVDPLELEGKAGVRLLCQAYIPGHVRLPQIAAWNGEVMAGFVREKLVAHPPPKGPSAVTRNLRAPEIREFSETLVRGFGMKGLFGFEFIVHDATGLAYLLETNRRTTPGTHTGGLFDVDLCAALFGAINGTPSTSRRNLDDDEEHVLAHFPQEWLRDPASNYLRDCRVDAPWDEPELFEAFLALRLER